MSVLVGSGYFWLGHVRPGIFKLVQFRTDYDRSGQVKSGYSCLCQFRSGYFRIDLVRRG
jgi:hypothetical protein